MLKPPAVFDRDRDWTALEEFASAPDPSPRIGIVHGRRRQGKSFLLRALVSQGRGLYHQALEEERVPALRRVGAVIGEDAGVAGVLEYSDWDAAIRALAERAGPDRVIVLDEYPYLLQQSPELSSVIQTVFDEARSGSRPPFRMLLCGSAVSVMTSLLSGQRALRGRAMLDLSLVPFDFRQAADFWQVEDPQVAFLVHAVVGGTPGYRPLLAGNAPERTEDFYAWLAAGVLNPAHAMFREADYLLTEDPAMTDRALYQSVLAAIAGGRHTRNAIGSLLQRDDAALRHPLLVLERAGFIRRDEDLLRAKRPLLGIDDPFLRFSTAIVRPQTARLEAGEARAVWDSVKSTFLSAVVGPHFEHLARTWTARFASAETLGGAAARVGFTQLSDAQARTSVEIDVVVLGAGSSAGRVRVLAIGEAKGGPAVRGLADLRKLERVRDLLNRRADAARAKLLLFARSGFEPDLMAEATSRPDLELVDLERLYRWA